MLEFVEGITIFYKKYSQKPIVNLEVWPFGYAVFYVYSKLFRNWVDYNPTEIPIDFLVLMVGIT